jgi:hypothetical protein
MVDPLGRIFTDLRADSALAAETGGKIWAEVPALWNGQPLPEDPRPYVLVNPLAVGRGRHIPIDTHRIAITCYGKDPRLAARLYGLVSDVLHDAGPRHTAGGTALYRSEEEVGGQPANDPLTGWPVNISIYQIWAASAPVP